MFGMLRWPVWFWCCDNFCLHGGYVWVCTIGVGTKTEGMK